MKGNSFRLFIAPIESPRTKEAYTYSLKEFMRFAKIQDYDDIVKLGTAGSQQLLKSWIIHLKNKKIKAKTIKSKLNAVKSFLETNDIIINTRILHKLLPSDDYVKGGNVPFTTEDIQKMLAATKELGIKALIHFFSSTSTGPSAIEDPLLQLKHVEDMPYGCKSIKLYDGLKEACWGFLTPEASQALTCYLNSRKLRGEELSPDSPVFANLSKRRWKKKKDYTDAKLTRRIISHVAEMAGIERTKNGARFDKAPVYGFKKRFNTILKRNSNVNPNIAEKLIVHKKHLNDTCLKSTREECFTEFVKVIHELTIFDEARNKFKMVQTEKEKSEIDILKKKLEYDDKTIKELKQFNSKLMVGELIPVIPRYGPPLDDDAGIVLSLRPANKAAWKSFDKLTRIKKR